MKAKSANFLFDELAERVAKGPITLHVRAQLANDRDTVDDATIHWPEDRTSLDLGTIVLTEPVADNAHEQKHITPAPGGCRIAYLPRSAAINRLIKFVSNWPAWNSGSARMRRCSGIDV